jgi:predicted SnoaL-like aldol condensation-catalyzing enzyme
MQDQKSLAISFLRSAAPGKLDEAYSHVSSNFRHHNAYFAGDAESLKAGMAEAAKQFPNTTLEVKHTIEEDDIVAVHSRVQHSPETQEIAVVHIFRFEGEKSSSSGREMEVATERFYERKRIVLKGYGVWEE